MEQRLHWDLAISKNRAALTRIIALLLAMAGLGDRASLDQPVFLPRAVYFAVLRLLRPAESALRRLIVIAARNVPASPLRGASGDQSDRPLPDFQSFAPQDDALRVPSFRLIDPRKRFAHHPRRPLPGHGPRISIAGLSRPVDLSNHPAPDTPMRTTRLARRLLSLQKALGDLPAQVRRLVRTMARRAKAPPGPSRVGPLRPGPPPGHRQRVLHEIDDILRDCHGLARQA